MTHSTRTIAAPNGASAWRTNLERIVDAPLAQRIITGVILLNGVILGLETSANVMAVAGDLLTAFDRLCLAIFVIELALKLIASGPRFFRNAWNLFDFVVVGISLLPATGGLSILRALRVLRVLRLVSVVPRHQLRRTEPVHRHHRQLDAADARGGAGDGPQARCRSASRRLARHERGCRLARGDHGDAQAPGGED